VDRDVTMKYMARFGCIGPQCEDHCCYGWRVDVDDRSYDKLIKASRLTAGPERRFVHSSFVKVEHEGRTRYLMKHDENELCVMLLPDGRCHIHSTYGEQFLSDVCTIFPRSILQIGDHLSMTGMVACPEVSRQLLLHDDAVDVVDLPHERVARMVLAGGMDPRDLRPYWRQMLDVRELLVAVLRDRAYSAAQRLFLVTWFAKRSAAVLTKDKRALTDEESAALEREIAALRDPAIRGEIARRFDAIEAPSLLVLLLARELVRPFAGRIRNRFKELVDDVFGSYTRLPELAAAAPEEVDAEAPAPTPAVAARHVDEVFAEYTRRRDLLYRRDRARMDRYLLHGAINYWRHHLPLGSPELMTHTLRMLGQMAVQKFLLVSHPRVKAALDASDEELGRALDLAAVEVFYKVGRHVEHTPILTNLEKALERRGLRSMAGAVSLIRF